MKHWMSNMLKADEEKRFIADLRNSEIYPELFDERAREARMSARKMCRVLDAVMAFVLFAGFVTMMLVGCAVFD